MITRALLRAKALQVLYANINLGVCSFPEVNDELHISLEKTYELYCSLLQLPIDFTRFVEEYLLAQKYEKIAPTEEDLNPNLKLAESALAAALRDDVRLREMVELHNLSWVEHKELLINIYLQMREKPYYKKYMSLPEYSIRSEREFWGHFFEEEVLKEGVLYDSLVELSVYTADDIEVMVDYVALSIKKGYKEKGLQLPEFCVSHDEEEFVVKLVRLTVENYKRYCTEMQGYLKDWELERMPLLDTIIIAMGMAELQDFPTIPANVTISEYVELAKSYSDLQHSKFVHALLDNYVKSLRESGLFLKMGDL